MSQAANNLRGFLARVQSLKRRGEEDALGLEFQEIRAQAGAFHKESDFTTEVGGSPENLKKNRYKDILPYDQTRVPVTFLSEEEGSDYINASFIKGTDPGRGYIATQGPLPHTIQDFWRMVWQYQVKVIVMACREVEHGKRKCERYWPLDDATTPAQFGPFTISKLEKNRVNAEVIYRKLRVTFREESRDISHFQYVAWPDRGIPDSYSCFLEMIQLVPQYQRESRVPLCVHCSAGCGRTGVICMVEYIQSLLQRQRVPADFSIFNAVLQMRRQRPSAVQTQEQYEFLYHAVTEMFDKELQTSRCYENLKEDKSPLYDDATSVLSALRQLPPQRKKPPARLPIGAEYPPLCAPEQRPGQMPAMSANETYAVVQKKRPVAPETRPQTVQYDNVPTHVPTHVPTPAPLDQLYSTVTHKGNRASSANAISSNYTLAGAPGPAETASVTYAQVPMPSRTGNRSVRSRTKALRVFPGLVGTLCCFMPGNLD
ncbi:tyrosine-protein phosphatase non-receptor type 18 [Xenopus tropicalis]|uniref:protein-tyrosine-phosphatase n=3 Tax=Xenopus tropicalis TaxID=8364 RepID=A0A803JDM5_XENTR|nr:tyrosine-protein phosphatase non-receptor type 18 [Xenopus tropicalis]